jgi:hypothetical protein
MFIYNVLSTGNSVTGIVFAHSFSEGYYKATAYLAKRLGVMFEVLMPQCHAKYQSAFKAGVWNQEDPGPWLDRARALHFPTYSSWIPHILRIP